KEFPDLVSPEYGTMEWTADIPEGTGVTMRVRTSNDPAMAGAHIWNDECNVSSAGTDISENACVNDGDRYVQYQSILSGSESAVPTLSSVTINTPTTFTQTFLKLIS